MTAAPFADFVPVTRCHKGQLVVEEILVELDGDLLRIRSDWSERKQDFRRAAEYRLEAGDSPLGRAFHLYRDAESVERDPDHEPSYWCLIAGDRSECDCKGKKATELHGRECKHVACLKHLSAENLL